MHLCAVHIDTNILDNIPSIPHLAASHICCLLVSFISITLEIFMLETLNLNTSISVYYGYTY